MTGLRNAVTGGGIGDSERFADLIRDHAGIVRKVAASYTDASLDTRRQLISDEEAIDLDFDKPLRVYEPHHTDEGAGWSDVSKELAMSARGFLPPADIGEHNTRPNNILNATAGLSDRAGGDRQALAGLLINVTRVSRSAFTVDRRGPCHSNIRPATNCTGEANRRL